MVLLITIALAVFGLILGSFVNALVWRVHEQASESEKKKPSKKYLQELSIAKGRSMCPDCHHELHAKDLVPVLSWLSVGGKCRYCRKPISRQYPIVELLTAVLFVTSYAFWPVAFSHMQVAIFVLWLLLMTGFMALSVYDLKWMLLPDRIMYPLGCLATLYALLQIVAAPHVLHAALMTVLAVVVGGGIFYVLFQVSSGKWIGGGDVKLGWLLGLLVSTPSKAVLFIFIAALVGTIVSLPLLANKKLARTSTIPFGPFLILGAIITVLFGTHILHWYQTTFLTLS